MMSARNNIRKKSERENSNVQDYHIHSRERVIETLYYSYTKSGGGN